MRIETGHDDAGCDIVVRPQVANEVIIALDSRS